MALATQPRRLSNNLPVYPVYPHIRSALCIYIVAVTWGWEMIVAFQLSFHSEIYLPPKIISTWSGKTHGQTSSVPPKPVCSATVSYHPTPLSPPTPKLLPFKPLTPTVLPCFLYGKTSHRLKTGDPLTTNYSLFNGDVSFFFAFPSTPAPPPLSLPFPLPSRLN
jgi:hypothetical protein